MWNHCLYFGISIRLEIALGRKSTFRNGPRLIDIDILFYDDLILETSDSGSARLLLAQRALFSDRVWDAFLRTSFPSPGQA